MQFDSQEVRRLKMPSFMAIKSLCMLVLNDNSSPYFSSYKMIDSYLKSTADSVSRKTLRTVIHLKCSFLEMKPCLSRVILGENSLPLTRVAPGGFLP